MKTPEHTTSWSYWSWSKAWPNYYATPQKCSAQRLPVILPKTESCCASDWRHIAGITWVLVQKDHTVSTHL